MKGKRLTPAAQADRDEFDSEDSCCSCHLSPPCGYCTHPGNPANQECDESCWEDDVDDEIDDLFDRSNWPPENTTRGNADGSTKV